jgi:hypothetical protein
MFENPRKNGGKKTLLRVTYAGLLLAAIGISYLFRHLLPGSWISWTVLGVCLVGLVITFAQIFYYASKST